MVVGAASCRYIYSQTLTNEQDCFWGNLQKSEKLRHQFDQIIDKSLSVFQDKWCDIAIYRSKTCWIVIRVKRMRNNVCDLENLKFCVVLKQRISIIVLILFDLAPKLIFMNLSLITHLFSFLQQMVKAIECLCVHFASTNICECVRCARRIIFWEIDEDSR